ncbi:MAG: NUDIX domain-containing protein [Gammaproteobacteria bacterium]
MTSEKEFLNAYRNSDFPVPLLTVDSVLFSVKDASLKILLLKRARHPHKSRWSLPGGFIDIENDKTTRDTAIRKLTEKTQVTPPYLEQLRTFSGKARDPRGWSATIAYFALIAHQEANAILQHADDAQWVSLNELENYQPLAFDHQEIIQSATERLRQKALYSMLPVFCLPKAFTLGQFHQVMQIILDKSIQKKSLYRRFEASDMFEETGNSLATGARTAKLYRLKKGVELVSFERNLGQ